MARSEEEQALFYQVFAQYLDYDIEPFQEEVLRTGKLPTEGAVAEEDSEAGSLWRWAWLLPPLLALMGLGLWLDSKPPVPEGFIQTDFACTGVGDTLAFSAHIQEEIGWGEQLLYQWQIGDSSYTSPKPRHVFDSAGTYPIQLRLTRKRFWQEVDTILSLSQLIHPRPRPRPVNITYEQKTENGGKRLSLQTDRSSASDLVYRWRIADTVLFGKRVSYPVTQGLLSVQLSIYWPEQEEEPACHAQSSRTLQIGQQEQDRSSPVLAPEIKPLESEGGKAYWAPWLPWAWLALLGTLLLALRPFRRYMKRQRSLSRLKEQFQAGDQPPYTLPLPSQEHLVSPEHEIYSLADALRQRKRGQSDELDVIASVRATVAQAGLPHIRFQQRSSPTAYLVLIDRQAAQDHQARLFGMLMHVLQEEDVQIDNFYFDGDPRFCYAEEEPEGFPLRFNLDQLYQRYGDRRLLIFAPTEVVAHPTRARLAAWVEESLLRWEERIWLTPKPIASWGYTDLLVYRAFLLLTADLSAQLQLVETLSHEKPDYFQLREAAREQVSAEQEDLYTLEGLARHLGPELLQWVAATTVHPEPRWEVTLSIGKALDEAKTLPNQPSLLSYENLYRLASIGWLQDGLLPEGLKRALRGLLHKEVELIARMAVLAMLEEVVLPDEAFARQEHRIQMAVHRSILRPEDKQAQRELLYLWENGYLKTPIPQAIQRQKRNNVLLLSLYTLLAFAGFYGLNNSPPPEVLHGTVWVHPPEPLALSHNQGVEAYEQGNFAGALNAYADALIQDSSDVSLRHNLDLIRYNEGRSLHNQSKFALALASYFPLKSPELLQSYKPLYAKGLAWAYLDSISRARAIADSLAFLSDSSWTSRKVIFNRLLGPTLGSLPRTPPDKQLQLHTSLTDSSQRSLLPFLDHRLVDIRAAALAILNSQTEWDSLIAARVPSLLNDPDSALRLQAALALLAHPPVSDSLLTLIQSLQQASPEPLRSLIRYERATDSIPDAPVPTPRPEVPPDSSQEDSVSIIDPILLPSDSISPGVDTVQSDSLIITDSPDFPNMVFIQGGSFQMGSEEESDLAKPIHEVRVSDFYLAKTEVTNAQYLTFANATQSHFPEWMEEGSPYNIYTGSEDHYKALGDALTEPTHPVVGVSWEDAVAYCEWLSQETGYTYRLPTEAEWEFAARGGNPEKGQGYVYAGSNEVDEVGWYSQNSDKRTHPVGQKATNGLLLYDMSGNVWEWCQDWYAAYPSSPQTNPQGPENGDGRVLRGGSWLFVATYLRVSRRFFSVPSVRNDYVGFRPARTP